MARISCPFCNASFEPPADGRVVCPRCGETVPVRGREFAPVLPVPPAPPPGPRSYRPLLTLIPGLALVGVGGALVLSVVTVLLVVGLRKEPPPPRESTPVAAAVPPAQLRGLAFLPAESNIVFGVQPGPILDYAKRTNQDPVALLTKSGVPTSALAALGQGGVSLDAIDHVAGGAFVPDADLTTLRLGVALVLRQPVPDEGKFLDALKARRPATGDPPHYVAEFAGLPVKVAKASDTVWLLGWSDRDVSPAGNGLPERMRTSLAETFPADTAAFALTDDADWAGKKSVSLLLTAGGKADWLSGLAKVRAVGVGLAVREEPTLRVMAKGATPASGEELQDAFRRQPGTTGETGQWVTLDTPADRIGSLASLRSLFTPPK